MTFAIVLGNADQIIQVSDRRLTWNGQLVDDAFNKAGHILCDDASLLYCFTGLARVGHKHVTSRWLIETFHNISRNTSTYQNLIATFAAEAEKYFSTSNEIRALPASHRRLTVMFSGYASDHTLFTALVSNFQDFINSIDHPAASSKFTVFAEISKIPASSNPTVIQAIGQFQALNHLDEKQIREMLESRAPAEALRQKAISLVKDIAMRHKSGGTVGCKLNTARIDFLDQEIPYFGYATDAVESEMSLVDQLDARSFGTGLHIRNTKITLSSPAIFPKVHRNALCPCGSGKKFRFCHRR
jgi:SEC-C motif